MIHDSFEFNWNPAVHERFGEQLYFFLIRFRDPRFSAVEAQIRNTLDTAGIRFACEYSIFGSWDALVRVWLTTQSYQRLLVTMRDPSSNVGELRHFQADKIRYLWSTDAAADSEAKHDLRYKIARHEETIRKGIGDFGSLTPDEIESLAGENLLIKRTDRVEVGETPGVKFYVALSRTRSDFPEELEAQTVLEAVSSTSLAAHTSLYAGSGNFASYFIRCVAPEYFDVVDWASELDRRLESTQLRTVTLLIAGKNPPESDNVNDMAVLSHDDNANLALLDFDSQAIKVATALPDEQRVRFTRLVRSAYDLSAGNLELRGRLTDLLQASITNNHRLLNGSLVFLLEIEWLVGLYLKRAWGETYGPQWTKVLADRFRLEGDTYGAELVQKPDEWTLGAVSRFAEQSAKLDETLQARFDRQLGSRWRSQTRSAQALRNDFAHGRFRRIDRLDEFSQEWGDRLAQLVDAAVLHDNCSNFPANS